MGPVAIPAEDVGNSHGTATICGVYHWFITGLSWFIIIFSHQDIPTSWRHPSANKVNSCATKMWLTLRYDHTCRREATEGLRIDRNAR